VIKDDGPVYRKQFQIPEAHNIFTEETVTAKTQKSTKSFYISQLISFFSIEFQNG